MTRILTLLLMVLFLLPLGCGSEKDRGINSAKDKPRAVEGVE